MKLVWHVSAWEDYLWFQQRDRQLVKRINQLITDVVRNGHDGIGKPEPLRGDWHGWWSRRVDREHRLVYRITSDTVEIAACRYHYGN